MDRSYGWSMHNNIQIPAYRKYRVCLPPNRHSSSLRQSLGRSIDTLHRQSFADIVDAKLRYESARTFDVDEDIEFNPCLTHEELNAAYAESSLSSKSGRSDAGSPPQQTSIPLPSIAYAQQQQQHHSNSNSGNGRYNSRKKGNAVPIVNPNYGNVAQWR